MPRFQRYLLLPVLLAALSSCTDGTGPGSLGQLRLRPVFASGEEPATLGIAVSEIHVVLRRAGGGVVADTSLPYVDGETTSWLIDLAESPESIQVSASIGQGAATMYSGSGPAAISTGIGPSSTQHDLPVRYLGGPGATFTIDVTPDSSVLVSIGETRQLTAVAQDADNVALSGFTFTWSSSRPDLATVDASGLVTAIAPGRAEITASSGGVSGKAIATVAIPRAPASVVVTPVHGNLTVGDSLRFKAVVLDASGDTLTGHTVRWSSIRPDIASVSDSGWATGNSVGHTTIIASLGILADSATLTVLGNGPGAASILVTPEVTTLTSLGATQQYTATAIDANGNVLTGVVFQWASSNGAVASVNATGLATALDAGATAISASANGVTGVAVLSVSLPPGAPLFIIVSPGSATLTALGATQQFTAIAFDSKGAIVPNVSFTWSSSNPAVASVSANGVATAVSPGSVSIVAAAAGRTGSASLSVTVPVVPASVLILGQRERPLDVGNSLQFTAEVRDANGNIMTGVTVTWQVLKPNIASIDPLTGVATGLVPGLTLIRASVGNLFDEVELVIKP